VEEVGSKQGEVLRMVLHMLVVRTFSGYNYYAILIKSFASLLLISSGFNPPLFYFKEKDNENKCCLSKEYNEKTQFLRQGPQDQV
jgi:hypothetical protein